MHAPNLKFGQRAGGYTTACPGTCSNDPKLPLLHGAAIGQFFAECEVCGGLLYLPVGSLAAAKVTLGLAGEPTEDESEEAVDELPEFPSGSILRVNGDDHRLDVNGGRASFAHVFFPSGDRADLKPGDRFTVEGVEGVFVAGSPPVEEPGDAGDTDTDTTRTGASPIEAAKSGWAGVVGLGVRR
jgi:hypothetical protein